MEERVKRLKILQKLLLDPNFGDSVETMKKGAVATAHQIEYETDNETPIDPEEAATIERFSAILEASFLIATADGELLEEEEEQLATSLLELTDNHIEREELDALIASFYESLETEGVEKRIETIAKHLLTKEERKSAYVIAVGLSRVDGHVATEETETCQKLSDAFGFTEEEQNDLLHLVDTWFKQGIPENND